MNVEHDSSLCIDCGKPVEPDYTPGSTEIYHFCRWCEPNSHFCENCQKKIDAEWSSRSSNEIRD